MGGRDAPPGCDSPVGPNAHDPGRDVSWLVELAVFIHIPVAHEEIGEVVRVASYEVARPCGLGIELLTKK